ncbi:MAG: tetratricopeptide repeat protein [Pseudomonadota bacterium]
MTACNTTDVGRGTTAEDLTPPGVIKGSAKEIDPLIVGDRLLEAGEAELALASYMRAAAQDGLTDDVRLSISLANIRLGRLGQAENVLRDVLRSDPKNAKAMNNLGVVLLERNELGEAHSLFRAAFALQPTPEIRDNLRVSSEKLEQRKRVLAHTEEDDAFTLSRRANGVYDLRSPDGLTP